MSRRSSDLPVSPAFRPYENVRTRGGSMSTHFPNGPRQLEATAVCSVTRPTATAGLSGLGEVLRGGSARVEGRRDVAGGAGIGGRIGESGAPRSRRGGARGAGPTEAGPAGLEVQGLPGRGGPRRQQPSIGA